MGYERAGPLFWLGLSLRMAAYSVDLGGLAFLTQIHLLQSPPVCFSSRQSLLVQSFECGLYGSMHGAIAMLVRMRQCFCDRLTKHFADTRMKLIRGVGHSPHLFDGETFE